VSLEEPVSYRRTTKTTLGWALLALAATAAFGISRTGRGVADVFGAIPPAVHAQAQAPAAATDIVVIRGGWLFDGIGNARVRNSALVVSNGKFAEIGASAAGSVPGARVIDLDDNATIVPGFVDMHAHYNMNLVGEGRVEEAATQAIVHLANGVTSTWSAGEFFPDTMFAAKRAIDSGKQPGTRIFPSGPYFGAFRCEYKIQQASDECAAWPNNITEQQIRDDLDYWADRGVRSIKIKQSTPNEMRILINQAHKRGITTTSHLANYAGGYDVSTKDAILMGLDRVEHWVVLAAAAREGKETLEENIRLFKQHHVYFDANQQMWGGAALRELPELKEKMTWVDEAKFFTPYTRKLIEEREAANQRNQQQNPGRGRGSADRLAGFKSRASDLKMFYDANGSDLLLLGTDNPTSGPRLPGFSYHREMEAMVYSGIPPLAVLKAATINGARALSMGDQLGSIEVGKIADLVIVNGNPLENITATREVRTVMKAGQVFDPKALLDSAANKIGPGGPADKPNWTLYDKVQPLGASKTR
jgi:imidazolonepropionase-like amidohydrolase